MSKNTKIDYSEIEPLVRGVVFEVIKNNSAYKHIVDDLIQQGFAKAIEVIDKYDSSRGASIQTYIKKCVKNEIINMLREETQIMKAIKVIDEVNIVDSSFLKYDLKLLEKHISNFIDANPGLFSEEDKEIIQLRIMGYKYDEIAKKIGKTKKYVDNSIQRIKKIIAKEFKL